MEPEFERYDYSHLVGSPAGDGDKEFDAASFDKLLTDDDRRLLECDMHISWWVYSDLGTRPFHQA